MWRSLPILIDNLCFILIDEIQSSQLKTSLTKLCKMYMHIDSQSYCLISKLYGGAFLLFLRNLCVSTAAKRCDVVAVRDVLI